MFMDIILGVSIVILVTCIIVAMCLHESKKEKNKRIEFVEDKNIHKK